METGHRVSVDRPVCFPPLHSLVVSGEARSYLEFIKLCSSKRMVGGSSKGETITLLDGGRNKRVASSLVGVKVGSPEPVLEGLVLSLSYYYMARKRTLAHESCHNLTGYSGF